MFAYGCLHWSVDQFYSATPRDLIYAQEGYFKANGIEAPKEREYPTTYEEMKRRFPD